MIATAVNAEIIDELERLDKDQQKRVLSFARSLTASAVKGVSGKQLLSYAGCIDADDLYLMAKAIEEGCERVDLNGW